MNFVRPAAQKGVMRECSTFKLYNITCGFKFGISKTFFKCLTYSSKVDQTCRT